MDVNKEDFTPDLGAFGFDGLCATFTTWATITITFFFTLTLFTPTHFTLLYYFFGRTGRTFSRLSSGSNDSI